MAYVPQEHQDKAKRKLEQMGISKDRAEAINKEMLKMVDSQNEGKSYVVDVTLEELKKMMKLVDNSGSVEARVLILKHNAYEAGVGRGWQEIMKVIEKDKRLASEPVLLDILIGRILMRLGVE